jgi:NADH dehydrogenase
MGTVRTRPEDGGNATDMRRRILLAFEAAEREQSSEKLEALMTFVIVGGGPTGVELAGALGEIAHDTLRQDFRNIDPSKVRIILVEGTDRVLPAYPPELSAAARKMLEHLSVTVRAGAMVTDVQSASVTVREGDRTETIPTRTILWAAGVLASPLGRVLSEETGATLDKAGRVIVEPDLTVPGHSAGQVCRRRGRAPFARRKATLFHYLDKGNLATIGRAAAVTDLNWLRLSGLPAWLIWIFIHLFYIIEFQNRLLVLVQWAWLYLTYNRSARLITGKNPLPLDL